MISVITVNTSLIYGITAANGVKFLLVLKFESHISNS